MDIPVHFKFPIENLSFFDRDFINTKTRLSLFFNIALEVKPNKIMGAYKLERKTSLTTHLNLIFEK
jgi:hypothetical protein